MILIIIIRGRIQAVKFEIMHVKEVTTVRNNILSNKVTKTPSKSILILIIIIRIRIRPVKFKIIHVKEVSYYIIHIHTLYD